MAWETALTIGLGVVAILITYIALQLDEKLFPLKVILISIVFSLILIGLGLIPHILDANSSSIDASIRTSISNLSSTASKAVIYGVIFPAGIFMLFFLLIKSFESIGKVAKMRKVLSRR